MACESYLAGCVHVHYVFEWVEGCGGGVEVLKFLAEVQLQDAVVNGAEFPQSNFELCISSCFDFW